MIDELCEADLAEVGGGEEGGPGYNFWDILKNLVSDYEGAAETIPG